VTLDVTDLLDLERARRVAALFAQRAHSGHLAQQLPWVDGERVELLDELASDPAVPDARELLARLGIRALVGDARACPLPAESVDLIVSNNTFEHIPPPVLRDIIAECRRLAAPGAVMSHFIDMSDHYAHFDRGISEFNYLRYPDPVWRLFNNELQYQSRLRAGDYRALIEQGGFRIAAQAPQRGDPAELAQLRPARRFRGYDADELLVLRCWITATPATPDSGDAVAGEAAGASAMP
jgi:hypothetical protein